MNRNRRAVGCRSGYSLAGARPGHGPFTFGNRALTESQGVEHARQKNHVLLRCLRD